jgi:large subunit ribosomal protein L5
MRDLYKKEVVPSLMKKFSYDNVNMIPKLEKIVVNCCTKDAVSNSKVVDLITSELSAITGQKPVTARAKTSIASFKLRKGMPIGAFVTLRGEKMYEFLDRLISISLPRVRDFRGISATGFDGQGNYTLGLKEQIIFPEINYDKIDKSRGMGISIITTAQTNEESKELLTLLGVPFRK